MSLPSSMQSRPILTKVAPSSKALLGGPSLSFGGAINYTTSVTFDSPPALTRKPSPIFSIQQVSKTSLEVTDQGELSAAPRKEGCQSTAKHVPLPAHALGQNKVLKTYI